MKDERETVLREEDIRPQELLTENTRLFMEDITTILRLKDSFVKIPCPACDSQNHSHLFDKKGFSFVICRDCATVFTNPRPTREQLADYYATSRCYKHYNDCLFPATEANRREKIFIPRAKKVAGLCEKYNIPRKSLVDAGAGFGTFCEEISKMSIFESVIAVEPSQSLAETCRKRGLRVYEENIENVFLEEVSIITSFELIEHLFWPKEFILSCARLLSKGGFLYLTSPNIKGFDMAVLGERNDNIIAPNHINFFHPDSLSGLIRECGLKIVELTTPGQLDVELVGKKIESKEVTFKDQPFLRELFFSKKKGIREDFQRFLSEHLLSSHLSVLARKC